MLSVMNLVYELSFFLYCHSFRLTNSLQSFLYVFSVVVEKIWCLVFISFLSFAIVTASGFKLFTVLYVFAVVLG